MIIGGFQKFSLIDYPGKISCIIFTQGCNFKCSYCHNPELVNPKFFSKQIPEKEIFSFLEKRRGKLDAVEITGGEPTLHQDLIEFIKKIKNKGFLVKLDTNGTNSKILEEIIKLKIVDYLAMDIKAPLEKYEKIVNVKIDKEKIKKSINLIRNSKLDYEFRTTIVRSQLSKKDIIRIGNLISGAKLYVLQKFVPSKTLNRKFLNEKTYSNEELESLRKILEEKYVDKCLIR